MTMADDRFRYNMSSIEAEIVVMAHGGATNKMMAAMLGLTEKRLEILRKSAMRKQKLAKEFENVQTKEI